MTLLADLLDGIDGVDGTTLVTDGDLENEASETIIDDHEISGEFTGPSFPSNPFLEAAQTGKGGLFANLGSGTLVPLQEGLKLSEFPTADGSDFGLDGQFMQPVYVNTTDEPIDIEVVSVGFGPTELTLGVGAYNETPFGTDPQWYRIPTGIGTPYPIVDGQTAWDANGSFEGGPIAGDPDSDYLLTDVSETASGYKIIWEIIGEGGEDGPYPSSMATSDTDASQPPEDDGDAIV